MNRNKIVYIAVAFIVGIIILAGYFFLQKPERATSNVKQEGKQVIVFKDIKYSGEKKGVVDWEIRAKLMRKYIDKPMVEMEGIKGTYKPKPDTVVTFTGVKGSMDTVKEVGSVQGVEVFYKGEYVIKSPSMEFDFQKSLAYHDRARGPSGEEVHHDGHRSEGGHDGAGDHRGEGRERDHTGGEGEVQVHRRQVRLSAQGQHVHLRGQRGGQRARRWTCFATRSTC